MGADSDLLRRARSGDPAAFDALVSRHGRLVLAVARRVTGHREDAEDVAQEAFLRFYRSLADFDFSRPVEPWLVRITLNVARSHLRRAPSRREEALPDRPLPGAPGSGPEQHLEAAEIRRLLLAAADQLSERERLVFLLRDIEQLPSTLIAQVLEITEVTVRRQSSEGRRKVIAWLRRHHPEILPPEGPQRR
ncbi:MAG: sigma-70 family RNA polymerase sigma factor [Acidobacteriota bacterium]|nr:sigma-70 family RNA polymerase sigma factor [Acidobacteriota bacterium]